MARKRNVPNGPHPEELLKKFGLSVRYYRRIQNLSQEDLSFRSGLHRNYISDIERGTRNISLKAISKIAYGLNVNVAKLFSEENIVTIRHLKN